MQTTNTTEAGANDAPTDGGSQPAFHDVRCVKSFTDLSAAMLEKDIDKFAKLVRQGIDTWRTAGEVLVKLAATTPDIIKRITERYPHISQSTLDTFLRIGRNEIWPPLLCDSSYGAKRLLECNYDLQKEYSQKPIQVAVSWRNGEIKSVEKKVSALSRSEAAIVFDQRGGINNLEQQAFRLPGSTRMPVVQAKPVPPPIQYAAPRTVNVDIGYFSITVKDGVATCVPCGRSTIAQPVRLQKSVNGDMSAPIVFYKTEIK